jgi:two-component system sensor histidine kinase ChvG
VLDRTADIADDKAPPLAPAESPVEAEAADEAQVRVAHHGLGRIADWWRNAWQFFIITQTFSSLTRRIVFLNVTGLLALSVGIIYLSQFRAGLIDARIQSLLVQGEIIAGAIATQGTADGDSSITLDPSKLQSLQPGQTYGPSEDALYGIAFPINPERVAPILRRLVSPTKTRARIYDRDGVLLVDSRSLFGRGDVLRTDLPSPHAEKPGLIDRVVGAVRTWLGRGDLPLYQELGPDDGKGYPEVVQALDGQPARMVRINDHGDVIVSVAVPVQRFRAVRGALMLSTQGADIDNMVAAERLAILKIFMIAAGVMVILSILLAGTIAEPVRRLADAAESVRRRIQSRVEIPDFTRRRDEIGHLSGTLRDMTNALYSRIEGIERFAADVAHELKNPLTSLRSAVETLPVAKTEQSRARLLDIIQHDVKRLDRLISDISDASRLDAELQRQVTAPVDLAKLLSTVVAVANEVKRDDGVKVTLRFDGAGMRAFQVPGHDSRLGQVVDNLIENARSFSPHGGSVRVACRRTKNQIEICVDDDGPGVRPDAVDKIFERFYTDRPHQGFGQNSGLGLSISKQIVDAHGGTIWVENRTITEADGTPKITGARFIVRLPAM